MFLAHLSIGTRNGGSRPPMSLLVSFLYQQRGKTRLVQLLTYCMYTRSLEGTYFEQLPRRDIHTFYKEKSQRRISRAKTRPQTLDYRT